MRFRTSILVLALGASVLPSSALAQVQLGGYVLTDGRVRMKDGKLLWNENRLNLELNASPTGDAHVFAEVWVRGFGQPEARSSSDLMGHDKRKSDPWDLVFREAYVDLYGFLSPNLDLRVGRQRIAWGTGDKINPTDNLNPDDLEDIWDFGRHVPTNSFLAKYYWNDVTISGVVIPGFTPAVFPPSDWVAALAGSSALPGGAEPSTVSDELDMPDNTVKGSASTAVKIAMPILGYDVSLSYYSGRSDFPVPTELTLSPDQLGGISAHTVLTYPRFSVLGTDLSGAIGDVGVWAEAGVCFPEEIWIRVDASGVGEGVHERVSLSNETFVRYLFGGDYTFHNGIYVNGQFIHGFVHELGRDALHDYFIGGIERKFRHDTVKLTVGGAVESPSINDVGGDHALIGMPEIAYYPADNSEIVFGVRLISGKGQSSFGQLSEMDEVFLAFKYAF